MSELWNQLHALEVRDTTAAAYMDVHRSRYDLPPGRYPANDLSIAVLLGLAEALVNAKAAAQEEYFQHARRHTQSVLVHDQLPGDVQWGIITAEEWPKTERTLIEQSGVVYFKDFLHSFWRRLRRRMKVW